MAGVRTIRRFGGALSAAALLGVAFVPARAQQAGATPQAPQAAGAGARRSWRRRTERRVRGPQRQSHGSVSERCQADDRNARPDSRQAAGNAAEAAKGTDLVADPVGRIPALVHSSRGQDDRGDGQEDRRLDLDDVLGRGRHHRREPQAVRRDLPLEHDRHLPRRSQRSGRHGRAPQGIPGLPDERQGRRRYPRDWRLVSRPPPGARRGAGRRRWRAPGAARAAAPRRSRPRNAAGGGSRARRPAPFPRRRSRSVRPSRSGRGGTKRSAATSSSTGTTRRRSP